MNDCVAGRFLENVVQLDGALQEFAKNAVLFQQAEQFAGHDGAEIIDPPAPQRRPFIVRAGVADEPFRVDEPARDGAEELHLFAAHHVGPIVLQIGNAGNDRRTIPHPDQRLNKVLDPRWRWHIRRLFPTAVGADHPGEQHRLVTEALTDFADRGLEAALRHRQDALMVLELVEPFARFTDKVRASVGGAPIDRNETICPAHAFSP